MYPSSTVVEFKVPATIVRGAGRRIRCGLKRSSKDFRKLIILSTLARHPIEGHFRLKVNNGKGRRICLTFEHANGCSKKANLTEQGPDTLLFKISGECICESSSRLQFIQRTIKEKLDYLNKWEGNNEWIQAALASTDTTKAVILCGFGKDEMEEDDDVHTDDDMQSDDEDADDQDSDDEENADEENVEDNDTARIQQLSEVITEKEIEEGGREWVIEIGGWLIKFLKMKINLLKIFHKSPVKKQKTKTTTRYFKT